MAGRAAPGAKVALLRNGVVHETAVADAAGQFALVPPRLPPGNHELTLTLTLPDGRTETSRQTVTVAVPTTPDGEVIVALASPDAPTRLLSAPRTVAAAPAAPAPAQAAPAPAAQATQATQAVAPRPGVVVATVEADESGRFFATGQAAPGATVRLYLNDNFLAGATAAPDGRWSFTIGKGLESGGYKVRLDDVDPATGAVKSRAEVPFQFTAPPRVASAAPSTSAGGQQGIQPVPSPQAPAALPAAPGTVTAAATPGAPGSSASDVLVPEVRSTTVTRGDSLWRISRRIYGRGVRYTVIYEANQQQIRDPARIYPGQIFVVPGAAN